jgi:hypothetical protein
VRPARQQRGEEIGQSVSPEQSTRPALPEQVCGDSQAVEALKTLKQQMLPPVQAAPSRHPILAPPGHEVPVWTQVSVETPAEN